MYGEPTIEQGHIDAALTDFAVQAFYLNDNFMSNQIAPIIKVKNQSGGFQVIDPREALSDEHEEDLTYGQESTELNHVIDKGNYATHLIGKAAFLPDGIRLNSDNPNAEEQRRVRYIAYNQAIRRERMLASLIDDVGNFHAAGHHFAAATAWDVAATDPKIDIDAAARLITLASGAAPNRMMLTPLAFDILTRNSEVRDLIRYGPTGPEYLRTGGIGDMVFNLKLLKAGAIYDSAAPLEAEATAFLWEDLTNIDDDWALIYYYDDTPSTDTAGFAHQFVWNANILAPGMMGRLRRFRVESREGEMFDLRSDWDLQITNGRAGAVITGIQT